MEYFYQNMKCFSQRLCKFSNSQALSGSNLRLKQRIQRCLLLHRRGFLIFTGIYNSEV
ncbi:hypothetical protein D3OALGA1CA_2671 [Olavius algarvensis associated proteobacterium Delta 3]|nr:hypothetical protein D3OALGB2SA_2621 [Olavius algarvensis associated proteobacterium Delta 3]CAB5122573.1 hypothetical protein D3OALGA1CA_2671 [Olavius algarvensis associated proteobacterium Delta 3]